jgi:hypothetical protein
MCVGVVAEQCADMDPKSRSRSGSGSGSGVEKWGREVCIDLSLTVGTVSAPVVDSVGQYAWSRADIASHTALALPLHVPKQPSSTRRVTP